MRVDRPVSDLDIELERVKGEQRIILWVSVSLLVFVALFIGMLGYFASLTP